MKYIIAESWAIMCQEEEHHFESKNPSCLCQCQAYSLNEVKEIMEKILFTKQLYGTINAEETV